MRLTICAVGRLKAGPERELIGRYVERAGQLGRQIGLAAPDFIELDESRARRPDDRKREEAQAFKAALDRRYALIALDEGGSSPSSESFAADLGRRRDSGAYGIVFAIGGADGLDADVLKCAEARLALGAMTWPHQIVRLLLVEQLYRAATILAGHPYHRS